MTRELRALKERREKKIQAWRSIVESAKAENRRQTKAEVTECDSHKERIVELEDEINRLVELEGAERSIAVAPGPILAHDGWGPPDPRLHMSGNAGNAAPPGNSVYSRSAGQFRSLGDYLIAVRTGYMPGQPVDKRLSGMEFRATGSHEGLGSEGGFLVQTEYGAEVMKDIYSTGEILKRVTKRTLGANKGSIKLHGYDESSRTAGNRWGGVQGFWLSESAQKTASRPKWRLVEISPKKVVCLWYASDELLEDVPLLGQEAGEAFTSELQFMAEDSIINGTGAGQPLGVLNSGCLVTQAKEVGQLAKTIVAENIINMWSRLSIGSKTNSKNLIWMVNPDIIPQLYGMGITVGVGGSPIFVPAGGMSQSPFNMLLGRPIIETEYNATLGTLGDIILADLGEYIIADKGGIKGASSIHVNFTDDETVYRWVYRVDGQTKRSTPLTPHKGSATTSAFVTLAART